DDVVAHDASIDADAAVAMPAAGSPARASARQAQAAAPSPRATDAPLSAPRSHEPTPQTAAKSRLIPHSAVRKRIADHMVQSLLQTAPHVTTVFEADLSAVIAHRSVHRAEFQQRGAPLTFTVYFLAAIVEAIRAVPEANSRWTDTALEI